MSTYLSRSVIVHAVRDIDLKTKGIMIIIDHSKPLLLLVKFPKNLK